MSRVCLDVRGRVVDCILTENWLNAAGIYLEPTENGPTQAYVDLGDTGLHGFFGELLLPPTISERTSFIDDPFWKHILKIILIVLVIVLILFNGYKLIA